MSELTPMPDDLARSARLLAEIRRLRAAYDALLAQYGGEG